MCIVSISSFGKDLSGKVLDAKGSPLSFVNVTLFSCKDSVLVEGVVSNENGFFTLQKYNTGDLVKVSAIGYKTSYLSQPKESMNIIVLESDTTMLGEVVVNGHRNYIKNTDRGIIVSMKDNPLSKLGSALDAIKQMPFIMGVGGEISVMGKGTPEIYLNHRKIRDISELQDLSPERIEKVEIVTSPGAKYSSDKKAVIIIRTKVLDKGLALIANARGNVSDVFYGMTGLDASWKSASGLCLYMNGNYSEYAFKQKGQYIEQFNNGLCETITEGTKDGRTKQLKVSSGFSYDYSENSVGIRYEFNRKPYDKYSSLNDIMTNAEYENSTIVSSSNDFSQNSRHYINSYGYFKFGSQQNYELSVDVDYIKNSVSSSSDVVENEKAIENNVMTSNEMDNTLIAAKADLSSNWKCLQIDLGMEYSFTKNNQSFAGLGTVDLPILNKSQDEEKQHLAVAYVAANYQFNKHWNARCELKFENTSFTYLLNGKEISEQSMDFHDWLPYIGINYQKDAFGASLSYSSNVNRPGYALLSNKYSYLSHTSWVAGNPLLKSDLTRNLDLNLFYNQTNVIISYIRSIREMSSVYSYNKELKANISQVVNLPNYNVFQITLGQSLNIGKWVPALYATFRMQDLDYGESEKQGYHKPIFNLVFRNRIGLPYGMIAFFNAMWTSRGHSGTVYNNKSNTLLDMGVTKSLGDWNLSIYWNDCFKLYKQNNQISTNGVLFSQDFSGGVHNVVFSASYSLKKKKSYKGKGAGKSEVNRM